MNVRDQINYHKQFPVMQGPPGAETQFDGDMYLYFGGTGYYCLQNNPQVICAAQEALSQNGTHCATSRAGYGNIPIVQELELEAAKYFATDDALYLATGFLSDAAGLQALCHYRQVDVIFVDEFSHFSNRDGIATTNKPVHVFRNRDNLHLEELLKKNLQQKQKPLVVTDGIFSIAGVFSPIPKHLTLMEQYDGNIWVDDAHGLGILGPNGRGSFDHHRLSSPRLFHGGTLAKAFGGFGGIIPGSFDFIECLRQGTIVNGGSYFAPAVAASLAGIRWVDQNPHLRDKLRSNALYLKSELRKIGLAIENNDLPIVSWTVGDATVMSNIQKALFKKKIAIQYCHYIGTGEHGVLRAVVFSTHTEEQIDFFVEHLKSLL